MEELNMSLADTFNLKNIAGLSDAETLIAKIEAIRGDLDALQAEVAKLTEGAGVARAKLAEILAKLDA